MISMATKEGEYEKDTERKHAMIAKHYNDLRAYKQGLADFTISNLYDTPEHVLRSQLVGRKGADPMFKDKFIVRTRGGDGGKGCAAFLRDKTHRMGIPNGGDGGKGGNIIFVATKEQKETLTGIMPGYRAEAGQPGSRAQRTGKCGKDIIIQVPLGTIIRKIKTDDEIKYDRENKKSGKEFNDGSWLEERDQELTDNVNYDVTHGQLVDTTSLINPHFNKLKAVLNRYDKDYDDRMEAIESRRGEYMMQQEAVMQQEYEKESSKAQVIKTRAGKSFVVRPKKPAVPEVNEKEEAESFLQQLMSGHKPSKSSERAVGWRGNAPNLTGMFHNRVADEWDLDKEGAVLLAARGGAGGIGNWRLGAHSRDGQSVSTPGDPGEEAEFELELKLIADVGLVGFPNAGKSTLLALISRAAPKIANYPFTTMTPQLGVLTYQDAKSISVADLPGLIKGAHNNRGLGHSFLRHVERTNTLVFVLDMAGTDGRDPWTDFMTLLDELEYYQVGLSRKPAIIAANKVDLKEGEEGLETFKKKLARSKRVKKLRIYPISAYHGTGVDYLKDALYCLAVDEPTPEIQEAIKAREVYQKDPRPMIVHNTLEHINISAESTKPIMPADSDDFSFDTFLADEQLPTSSKKKAKRK